MTGNTIQIKSQQVVPAQLLQRSGGQPPSDTAHHDKLMKQTEKWVAQTFFGQLLKQMRESPFHNEMFDGGRGGKVFNEMLDQHLADHMAKGAGSKLVKAIVRRLESSSKAAEKYQKAQGAMGPEAVSPVDRADGGSGLTDRRAA